MRALSWTKRKRPPPPSPPSHRCDYVFYGLRASAQLAAFAFAAAFNRTQALAAGFSPDAGAYEAAVACGRTALASRAAFTRSARASYCDGVARGLQDAVARAKREEKARAEAKLARARARAAAADAAGGARREAYAETSEDDDEDDEDDEDDAGGAPTEDAARALPAAESASERIARLEREQQTTLALVSHTAKVCERVLEAHDVKLSHAKRAYTRTERNASAFRKGEQDAATIDMNQRTLREE